MFGSNLNILVSGSGCCKQEIFATQGALYDIQRFGINFVNTPENADILVMQGFYNKKGIIRVLDIYKNMQQPKAIIAVGSCVLDGNPFDPGSKLLSWFRSRVKIIMYVPGCPPRPEAFMYAILRLLNKK
ncbi:MAG: NADH-quinone oxidoreductase subunit B [Actinomycetota bacterium]|nr:NADH-quinone oxidoreductase subunit B [Actinomycetota bacterium]